MLTRSDLSAFLTSLGGDVASLDDEDPIFSSSVLDSFRLVDLMVYLEERGGFRIDPLDVTLENLDTMGRILRFFEAKATSKA